MVHCATNMHQQSAKIVIQHPFTGSLCLALLLHMLVYTWLDNYQLPPNETEKEPLCTLSVY